MVVTCSCMAADCHNGTSSCRNANHVCCSATIPILLVLSSRRGRAALGRGGCGTHQLALRVLPEKEQASLPASLVFSGGPFFSAHATHACGQGGADADCLVNVATHAAGAGAEHWRRDGRWEQLGEAGGWGPRGTTAWIRCVRRASTPRPPTATPPPPLRLRRQAAPRLAEAAFEAMPTTAYRVARVRPPARRSRPAGESTTVPRILTARSEGRISHALGARRRIAPASLGMGPCRWRLLPVRLRGLALAVVFVFFNEFLIYYSYFEC